MPKTFVATLSRLQRLLLPLLRTCGLVQPSPNPKRVAVYARTATTSVYPLSLARQTDEVTRYAVARGFTVSETYADVGSGLHARPGLEALIASAEAGRINAVFVSDADRLYRDVPSLLQLWQRLTSLGVEVYALRHGEIDAKSIVFSNMMGSDRL